MSTTSPARNIAEVFEEFLADQKARISPKTYSKYETIIDLYKAYLESYWPDHDNESAQVSKGGGTFCGTFGPAEALAGHEEFLGYFMPRKVMCGKETMKAAGSVTKKLAKWLANKGYIKDTSDVQERASEAAKDLPNAQEVLALLEASLDDQAPAPDGEIITDHFWINKIEPGTLWLEPLTASDTLIGPVPVPSRVTQLCRTMWDIGGVVARTAQGWRLVEVWNVTP